MTFLNPLVLFGLFAAAIPVLLHLLSLRRLRTIEFSTLQFIKELQRTRIRRLKLRQLLLLLLRTLLVVLLVFAFSRPTLHGSIPLGVAGDIRSSAVILVDNSLSMTASDEHGEYLKQARETASSVLQLFQEHDEIFVLPLSEPGSPAGPPPFSPAPALAIIDGIKPSPVHRKLEEALRVASRLLSSSRNFNKEVYVLSDFQKGLFDTSPGETEPLFEAGVRFFAFPLGTRELRNLSVSSITIPGAIFEKEKPFLLKATVRNHARTRTENQLVSVFLDGTRVAQRSISLDGGSSGDIEFTITPRTSGFLRGFVELEDDDLLFDNRRYFSLHLPDELRILMVGENRDLRYIATALRVRQESGSALRLQETGFDRLTSSLSADHHVVILANPGRLAPVQLEALRRFVSEGGGLIIFPGQATTREVYSPLQQGLGLPLLRAIESTGTGDEAPLEFDRVELQHPLFQGMFTKESRESGRESAQTLESPALRAYLRFEPSARATPIITIAGGSPFLLEQQSGLGRILLYAVPADRTFSDFPIKGIFVPLLHRSIAYAAQEQVKQPSVNTGQEIILTGLSQVARPTVVTPLMFEIPILPAGRSLRISETREPGTYEVRDGKTVIRTFNANVDPDESSVEKADEETVLSVFQKLGAAPGAVTILENGSVVRTTVLETRHGVELWKGLLLAALIVAIIEALIARESRRELARFSMESA